MKTVTYQGTDGPFTVEYDETAPCVCCGLPVGEASMGGTVLCPACDCGMFRDHVRWAFEEAMMTGRHTTEDAKEEFRRRAARHVELTEEAR